MPSKTPGIITILGNYTATGTSLNLELADGNGITGTSFDQLRVGGDINVSNAAVPDYATIKFINFGGFVPAQGDVFQVIAGSTGAARNTLNQFDLVEYTGSTRVLFDHATGKAYGTGLMVGTGTFRDYGVTANQKEIGRALWMEAIAYDKSILGTPDENFSSTALDPAAAAAKTGYKAFIRTANAGLGAGEEATRLGLAAVGVLTAADPAAALDAFSPEVYAGIADGGVRVAREFVRKTFRPRWEDANAPKDWSFEVGYSNDQLTTDGSSAYTRSRSKGEGFALSAARDIGRQLRLTLGVGNNDAAVSAQNFHSNIETGLVGLGFSFAPKVGRVDIALAQSTADWDANRAGATTSQKKQRALSAGARFTGAPSRNQEYSFTPFGGVSYARSPIAGFTETGGVGSAPLAVDPFARQSLQSELGVNVAYQLPGQTTLTSTASWEHEFRNSAGTPMTAHFVETGADDTRFNVNAKGVGADLFRVGVNYSREIGLTSAVSFQYKAIFGSTVSAGRQFALNYARRF
jgi:hypothetical protein